MLHRFLFQLGSVLAGNPALPNLLGISFLFGGIRLGFIRTALVHRNDDPLQGSFYVLLGVLVVIILYLLVCGMSIFFDVMLIESLRQDLILGEGEDLLHLGVVFQPQLPGGV